jgi:hypothetical protein
VTEEVAPTLVFLPARLVEGTRHGSFVVIVRTRDEFLRWLREPLPGAEWLHVEGLLSDQEVWAVAAQGTSRLPLDVLVSDPAAEFASLYRLADVRIVRNVRVTIPAKPGLMKALRLAASLQLPVRILPGQPSPEVLTELQAALEFYLHDPAVEAPVEFFHSLLAAMRGEDADSLWSILEKDPAVFTHTDDDRHALFPRDFAETWLRSLIAEGAECAECRWLALCGGYFKWPDPAYACAGVTTLFATLEAAAEEMQHDLAAQEEIAQ